LDAGGGAGQTDPVIGALIIVAVLLVFIPIGVMMTLGGVAGVLGYFLKKDVDDDFEGTEYAQLA